MIQFGSRVSPALRSAICLSCKLSPPGNACEVWITRFFPRRSYMLEPGPVSMLAILGNVFLLNMLKGLTICYHRVWEKLGICSKPWIWPPFKASPWPDDDVQFVAFTIAVWRDELPVLAQRQRHALQTLHKAVEPVRCALQKLLCPSGLRVSASKNPAFVILRWPDHGQAECFVHGFPIVGEVAFSGVFRPVGTGDDTAPETVERWLQRDGQQSVDKLLQSPPPKGADEML